MSLNFALSAFPIILLIWMMTKKNSVPAKTALPLTALLVYLLHLLYFSTDPNLINATVVQGMLSAITPISIIAGAILLTRTLQVSGAENTIKLWLTSVTPNPVAQLMTIGWAFAFTIEGASGFGTPAAIAAPILVGLGFNPLKVALLALVMNSVPVSFGAVGTPTWFGFGNLGLSEADLLATGFKASLVHFVAALVIPVMALRFVVSWEQIRRNISFIYLSILSCTTPYVLLASFNYEFPALVAGAIGFSLSILLAKNGIGLSKEDSQQPEQSRSEDINMSGGGSAVMTSGVVVDKRAVYLALAPMLILIGLLLVTRIQQLGIKSLLTSSAPWINAQLGSLGDLSISQALVFKLAGIFGTDASWAYKALYVPAVLPFLAVVLLSIPMFKMSGGQVKEVFSDTYNRCVGPFITLMGALAMVRLMMLGGDSSPILIIGNTFADLTGTAWQFFAAYLGAVGAFFSGSCTVSNLTFGAIQQSIAQSTGLETTSILALQSVGGSMGNMVCINNIIAVSTILGFTNKEGFIISKTVVPMLVYGAIAGGMSLII